MSLKPLEMPRRHTDTRSDPVDRDETALTTDVVHCCAHLVIDSADVHRSHENLLNDLHNIRRVPTTLTSVIKRARQRRVERVHRNGVSHQPMLRLAQQGRGPMRVQPDPDHGHTTGRSKIDGTEELPREDRRRLAFARTVRNQPIERIAKMENDLGPAVRQHRLHVSHVSGVALESPDAIDDRRQRPHWRVFPVSHRDAATLARVSDSFKRTRASRARVRVEE
jgi:hypothetical protein